MKSGLQANGYRDNEHLHATIQKEFINMPKNKEKELQDIYNKIFAKQAVRHMKKYEPQMVAGTLDGIAIRLYKTTLDDDGFSSNVTKTILDSEEDINLMMIRRRYTNGSISMDQFKFNGMFVEQFLKLNFLLPFYRKRYMMLFRVMWTKLNKQAARNFLTSNNENLQTICEMAGRNSQYVSEKIRKKNT